VLNGSDQKPIHSQPPWQRLLDKPPNWTQPLELVVVVVLLEDDSTVSKRSDAQESPLPRYETSKLTLESCELKIAIVRRVLKEKSSMEPNLRVREVREVGARLVFR
jgi:hypothetical protein